MHKKESSAQQEVDRSRHLKRVYWCELSSTFHATSSDKAYHALEEIERAFTQVMADTVRLQVIHYLEDLYKDNGVYKATSRMVRDALKGVKPGTVAAEITHMKRSGTITDLKELVPGHKSGSPMYYFALSSVLDKVTKPDTKSEVAIPAQVKEESKAMAGTTKTAAPVMPTTNPLEKVYGQLEVIAAQLKGLSQGYTEVSTNLKYIREGVSSNAGDLFPQLSKLIEDATRIPVGLTEEARNQVVNATVIRIQEQTSRILDALENVGNSPIPANATSEYKDAFKDGIKFAIEMGLDVRS